MLRSKAFVWCKVGVCKDNISNWVDFRQNKPWVMLMTYFGQVNESIKSHGMAYLPRWDTKPNWETTSEFWATGWSNVSTVCALWYNFICWVGIFGDQPIIRYIFKLIEKFTFELVWNDTFGDPDRYIKSKNCFWFTYKHRRESFFFSAPLLHYNIWACCQFFQLSLACSSETLNDACKNPGVG